MVKYNPDGWVIVKAEHGQMPIYKVFASWYGGCIGSDNWRLNSGITSMKENKDYYEFYGYSGNVYNCPKNAEGVVSSDNEQVLKQLLDQEGVSVISFEDLKEEFCL